MIIDSQIQISNEEFREQIENTDNIISLPLAAPRNKMKMNLLGTLYQDMFSGDLDFRHGWMKVYRLESSKLCCNEECELRVPLNLKYMFNDDYNQSVSNNTEAGIIKPISSLPQLV